jgi:hypothetical protein
MHSASDHMSEPCMKALSFVLQDHIACHDDTLTSSFTVSVLGFDRFVNSEIELT